MDAAVLTLDLPILDKGGAKVDGVKGFEYQ